MYSQQEIGTVWYGLGFAQEISRIKTGPIIYKTDLIY